MVSRGSCWKCIVMICKLSLPEHYRSAINHVIVAIDVQSTKRNVKMTIESHVEIWPPGIGTENSEAALLASRSSPTCMYWRTYLFMTKLKLRCEE